MILMQCFDNGSLYTVTVTRAGVSQFKSSWPCSGLRNRPVTFQFRKDNGDLVDSNDQTQHPNTDGGALVALSESAMRYGARKLDLNLPR